MTERDKKFKTLVTELGRETPAMTLLLDLLNEDVLEATECNGPDTSAEQGRYWAGVASHAHNFRRELLTAHTLKPEPEDSE
tara:strand:+ start:2555 stop:2797 length:243 start_codon:yes stop_codon:yes gene_type:complete